MFITNRRLSFFDSPPPNVFKFGGGESKNLFLSFVSLTAFLGARALESNPRPRTKSMTWKRPPRLIP